MHGKSGAEKWQGIRTGEEVRERMRKKQQTCSVSQGASGKTSGKASEKTNGKTSRDASRQTSGAVLEIKDLQLSFHGPKGRVQAIRGVDLQINQGEVVALAGESGSGKTALCRAVMRLHSQHASIDKGQILLEGMDVTHLSEKEMESVRGRQCSMVFQDPMSSLNPVYSVGKQITEAILLHEKISPKQAQVRASELLRQMGIEEPEKRFFHYPHQFSGGQRQRIAIAIAMACSPKLLIADEPTTALDIRTQNEIMGLLKSVQAGNCEQEEREKDHGAGNESGEKTKPQHTGGMLFVTHDLGLAEQIADRIYIMKDGLVVESGRTEEIFSNPKHEYTRQLLGYAAYGKGTSHYHGHISDEKPHRSAQCDGHPLVSVHDLSKSFELSKNQVQLVLQDFSMNIFKGEILGIVGDSGCGKSTLARCIARIYEPDSGRVSVQEGTKLQMIFQDSMSAFNPRMTLAEIIAEPLVLAGKEKKWKPHSSVDSEDANVSEKFFERICSHRKHREKILQRVYDVMKQVELDPELAERHPYDVSGGQRQRAAIARALITEPDFLIADEPISSLDVSIQAQIIHLLKKLHDEKQLTMMIISHDLPMVEHISDRIIKIEKNAE